MVFVVVAADFKKLGQSCSLRAAMSNELPRWLREHRSLPASPGLSGRRRAAEIHLARKRNEKPAGALFFFVVVLLVFGARESVRVAEKRFTVFCKRGEML